MFDTVIPPAQQSDELQHIKHLAPGPALGAALSEIDPSVLSGYDQIIYLQASQRQVSHYQATYYQTIDSLTETFEAFHDDLETAIEGAATEVRMALRLTRSSATRELDLAYDLHRRLPIVAERLSQGLIDLRRARVLIHGTQHLSPAEAQSVVAQIIDRATELTTGQLTARLRTLCIAADPDQADRRYNTAIEQRRIVIEPTPDGTAHLHAYDLPPGLATAAANRIHTLAKNLRQDGESRSMDQLRSDVFIDLLTEPTTNAKNTGESKKAVVDLRVDLATLAELNDRPGDVGGYGPVIADIARQIAEGQTDQQWRYTIVDPDTGLSIDSGITRRRPNHQQRRITESRHDTCIIPGCRIPATQSDHDHTTPYAEGGPTTVANTAPICEYDHTIRHRHGLTYKAAPNGDYIWTTQLGHTYTTSGRPP